MSLMRRHQQQVLAKQAKTAKKSANIDAHRREYKKWLGKMHSDQTSVKSFTDHSDRNAKAAEVVDAYIDYLHHWIGLGIAHQNDVLTQAIVWAVDGERWDILFDLADPAIANPKIGNLHWMERDLGSFVADIILKTAKSEKDTGTDIKSPIWNVLERIQDERWEVNHIIKARYFRFCGIEAEEAKDWEKAAPLFTKAHDIYPAIGVKKKRDQAVAQLNAIAQEPPTETDSTADSNKETTENQQTSEENTTDDNNKTSSPEDSKPPVGESESDT